MSSYPGNDLELGTLVGSDEPLSLSRQDRARHTYVVGATRTGKTKLLEGMARQDLVAWPDHECPLIVIDPHGTLYKGLMDFAAAEDFSRWPIVPLDLRRDDWVVSYNLLRRREGVDPAVICRGFVDAIVHAWGQANTNETPRLATWLETLLMLAYERECSLAEAMLILRDPELRKLVADEVKHVVARATLRGAQALKENDFLERVESTLHRVNRFLSTQLLRATLCQRGKSLDLSETLEKGQILLANLSVEGTKIADEDAAALGSVLLTDLWTAARRRGKREEGGLRPCYLYIDEFQNFVTPTIAKGLSEASGFGLHLTLAHQFPSQLTGHSKDFGAMVLDAVLANAKNKLVFQLSHSMDLQALASILYRQQIDPNQVKDEVWGTKVVGHEVRYLTSHSTTESQSTERGWQRGRSDSTGRTGGTSVGRSRGVNDTHTISDGTSDSRNSSFSTSDGVNEGWSDSHSASRGESESSSTSRTSGEQETWSLSSGRNDSTSTGANQGRSQSLSFGPQHKEFQRELNDYLAGKLDAAERAAFERKWPNAHQLTDSQGTSASESHGTNESSSAGGGRSSSEGRSDSRGTSHEVSVSHGRNGGRSSGQSRSSGSESGRSHSDGVSRGHSSSTQDGVNEGWSAQSSESFGESGSESETVSHGETVSPMLFPIYGKELSSRQFASVEEQVFGFMRFLDGQPDRHCVARLASMGSPAQIQTRTVTDPLTTAKWSRRWAEKTLSKLPFVKRMDEALKELAEREANVVNAVRKTAAASEPENYRRRIGPARPKPPSPSDVDNKE